MSDFFENTRLEQIAPPALRSGGERGLEEVAGKHHDDMRDLSLNARRVGAVLYLAHAGKLKDKSGEIFFSLTPAELAAWLEVAMGDLPAGEDLKSAVEELKGADLARFYERRECRATGEEANAYRFESYVFPVGEVGR